MLSIFVLNIWNTRGPWEKRLQLIRAWIGLLRPDLIAFQEVLRGDRYDQAGQLFEGLDYHQAYAGKTGYTDDPTMRFGNLIAARRPIVEREEIELPSDGKPDRRVLLRVTVDSPHGPLCLCTTQLSAHPWHGYIREKQMRIAAEVTLRCVQRSSCPPILCGDFNADPESAEIGYAKGRHSIDGTSVYFVDCWEAAGDGSVGATFSRRNLYVGTRTPHDRRIDYIFVPPPDGGAGRVERCDLVCDIPRRGVFASDHFGLYAELATE